MGMFTPVDGALAVLNDKGVFKEALVYARRGVLYARYGVGYVRLYSRGETTKPGVSLSSLAWEGDLYETKFGMLCLPHVEGSRQLAESRVDQLLLGAD